MLIRIMKRSSCAPRGGGRCPRAPKGFCVAMTMKGGSSSPGTPSTVTWRSSMASRRAAWVLGLRPVDLVADDDVGEDRPGLNTKSLDCRSHTETPVMSEGRRSGVNWMRRKEQVDRTGERFNARGVLPTPGTSSTRDVTPAVRPVEDQPHRVSRLPMTSSMLDITAESRSANQSTCSVGGDLGLGLQASSGREVRCYRRPVHVLRRIESSQCSGVWLVSRRPWPLCGGLPLGGGVSAFSG